VKPAVIFTVEGRVVGTTRSTNQRTISRIMRALAQRHIGKEVKANYV
jgi:hypothetical protein